MVDVIIIISSNLFVVVLRDTVDVIIFTSPAGAVAKYCNEHVCVCVCLSASISLELQAQSLPNVLCMLPMAVARSSSDRLMQSQREVAILGVCIPINNASYGSYSSISFAMKHRFGLNLLTYCNVGQNSISYY